MTLHNPVWLHADSYDAVDFRNSLSSLLSSTGGIVGSGDYAVSAPASGMSVNVAAGQIWVPGTQVANQGQYYMLNDGTISVTVPAADPTNPRIDLIVAQIVDTQYGGASNTGEVVDVSGTPAASPVAPSAPANSLVLAQVYVGAGVTSITSANITDERGARLSNLGDVGKNVGLFGVAGAVDGAPPAAGIVQWKIQAATTVVTTNSGGSAAVTFPVAFPNGVLTIVPGAGDSGVTGLAIQVIESQVSTTGFGFQATVGSNTQANAGVRINWIAIGW